MVSVPKAFLHTIILISKRDQGKELDSMNHIQHMLESFGDSDNRNEDIGGIVYEFG